MRQIIFASTSSSKWHVNSFKATSMQSYSPHKNTFNQAGNARGLLAFWKSQSRLRIWCPDFQVGIQCAVHARKIIGPLFFFSRNNTFQMFCSINSDSILHATDKRKENVWLLHEGQCHNPLKDCIRRGTWCMVDNSWLWPPRSTDLNPPCYYL